MFTLSIKTPNIIQLYIVINETIRRLSWNKNFDEFKHYEYFKLILASSIIKLFLLYFDTLYSVSLKKNEI